MCVGFIDLDMFYLPCSCGATRSRGKVQIQRRKRSSAIRNLVDCDEKGTDSLDRRAAKMMLRNLELYRKNQNIMKENEKLRQKALLLKEENKALLSLLQLDPSSDL
ncbi:hypothetical protein Droror1_Dr00000421 [Drosera rotundifolia]